MGGGVRCSRLWSTSHLLRPSGQQCSHSGGVCPQIQGWQCGAYVGAVEEMMCVVCVWMLQSGHSGDGCVLASTLCKYDLRKGDLFVLNWARVRRVRRGSLFSELLMCGEGVRSILLLPLVDRCLEDNRCMYMAHVSFYVCCSDCVGVCGNFCCVAAVVKNSGVLSLGVLKYVVCLCRGCDGCCVFCLYCKAWSCRCSCMGSVSVSSCRCCMFVSCVQSCGSSQCCVLHDLQFVNAGRGWIGDHTEDAYSRAGLIIAL